MRWRRSWSGWATSATWPPRAGGLRRVEQNTYDIVITDLVMNEVDGMQLLARTKEVLPECQVIMVTGHASVPKAVEAMQQGAFNFLEKPITSDRLRAVFERAVDAVRLRRQNIELTQRLDERFGFEGIIYASDKMQAVIDRLKRIAPTDATVLITGRKRHRQGIDRPGDPPEQPAQEQARGAAQLPGPWPRTWWKASCSATSKAPSPTPSPTASARSSTPTAARCSWTKSATCRMSTQVKLLRVLEENQITRVGDNKPITVNVRLVSATNRNLEQAVETGEFRRDLYYRIKVITIQLPPLARTPRGHPAAGGPFPPAVRQAARQVGQGHLAGRQPQAVRLRLAGQRAASCGTPSRRWSCWTPTACWTSTTCRRNWLTSTSPGRRARRARWA